MPNLPEWITFQKAAEVAGVARSSIKRWVRDGKLAARYPKPIVGEVKTIDLLKLRFPGVVTETEMALAVDSQVTTANP